MRFFLKFFLLVSLFFGGFSCFASFEIAEIMPNTIDDTNLEYITLKNLQNTSQSLSGFTLKDASGKSYTFTGVILEAKQRKQFFRPQTKIILNNTDETLTLFSPTGPKIDEITYKTSTKEVFLSFEDIIIDEPENTISDELIISGEIYISSEVILPPKDTSSGNDISLGNLTPTLIAPEVIFQLQRPSYISQSGSSDSFVCDSSQDECKVNFDLSPSFTPSFPAKNYRCELDFGLGYVTGEEQKCNPNTIIFPLGTTKASFTIIHKSDEKIFSKKIISIMSQKIEFLESTSTISGPRGGENILESPRIQILDPLIEIQSGVTGLGTNFFCEKAVCKVNVKYKKIHSLERCYWDFGAGEASSESTRKTCNPGVVTFGPGVHELFLRVYESSRESNEKRVRFFVHNTFLFPGQKEEIQELLHNQDTKQIKTSIHLQGKISKEKILGERSILCENVEKCNINFEALFQEKPEKERDLKYIWKQNGDIFSQKQNPSGIWIETGKHEITLEVYEGENIVSRENWLVEVSGKFSKQEKVTEKRVSDEIENLSFSGRIYDGLIIGNILPNPAGNDFKEFIEIQNISSESRMLGGCILHDSSRKYKLPDTILIAGNSQYFFNSETKISLSNSKDIIIFSCNGKILGEKNFERKMKDNELLSGEIFPGFTLSEIQTYIPKTIQQEYLEKSLSLKLTILKREGFKIYGFTFPNTKIELLSDQKALFTLRSDASGKFILKTKDIFAGEYHFDIRLSQDDISFTLPDFKTLSLSPAARASWFQKAKRKSKLTSPTIPKLLVSREMPREHISQEKQLSTIQQIFFHFLLAVVGLMSAGHLFFIMFPRKNLFLFQQEILSCTTRQKIILLGV